jgi:hypothetical protein
VARRARRRVVRREAEATPEALGARRTCGHLAWVRPERAVWAGGGRRGADGAEGSSRADIAALLQREEQAAAGDDDGRGAPDGSRPSVAARAPVARIAGACGALQPRRAAVRAVVAQRAVRLRRVASEVAVRRDGAGRRRHRPRAAPAADAARGGRDQGRSGEATLRVRVSPGAHVAWQAEGRRCCQPEHVAVRPGRAARALARVAEERRGGEGADRAAPSGAQRAGRSGARVARRAVGGRDGLRRADVARGARGCRSEESGGRCASQKSAPAAHGITGHTALRTARRALGDVVVRALDARHGGRRARGARVRGGARELRRRGRASAAVPPRRARP